MKGWLKVKSAAAHCDVSVKTVRLWLKQGLPHARVGGLILIRRESLDEFLEGFTKQVDVDTLANRIIAEIGGI